MVALAFILFEGGLSAGFGEIRPVLGTSIVLATLGTLGTAALTAVPAALLFDLDPLEALLLGSTVAATDAAPCSRSCADRRCGAGWRAHSRASRASTTRSRSCS